jgi:hypothetical protein
MCMRAVNMWRRWVIYKTYTLEIVYCTIDVFRKFSFCIIRIRSQICIIIRLYLQILILMYSFIHTFFCRGIRLLYCIRWVSIRFVRMFSEKYVSLEYISWVYVLWVYGTLCKVTAAMSYGILLIFGDAKLLDPWVGNYIRSYISLPVRLIVEKLRCKNVWNYAFQEV